ncbi:MAG: NADH-dependent phenylglyoxylate [Chloroflexi bacterium]|nr:NADH-dependent phenylglyoxylate [Chloroflexota bacterium]
MCNRLGSPDIMGHGTSMCMGCGGELALRTAIRVFGENTILFGAPGCAALGVYECYVPTGTCLLTNVAPMMEGVKRYHRQLKRDVEVVAFVGDGATADAGFQSLSGAAERGEKLVYICYDNEAYMNTGIQRSGTTPRGAWTTTTPVGELGRGKKQSGKNMPLIMAMHGIPFVATASVAYMEDYVRKLEKARALREGMAYIHVLAPCPTGWRAGTGTAIEISRLAVETNYFPLWEFQKGVFALTHQVPNPKPVQRFTRTQARFAHMTPEDLDALQKTVDERVAFIKKLAG